MAIYLYCLTEPACGPADDLRGIGDAPVRAVSVAERASAWVSDLPEALGPATAELVRVHDRVVRAALSGETPLPARFGQSFAGEDALRRALEARAEAMEQALERVRGGVEMTVRVLLPEAAVGPAVGPAVAAGGDARLAAEEGIVAEDAKGGRPSAGGSAGAGRAYMDRLRERQQESAVLRSQAEFLQARVARAVDSVAREEVCSPVMPGTRSFSVSHLVARGAVAEYRLAVDTLLRDDPSLRLLVSGPWAPYSFARIVGG